MPVVVTVLNGAQTGRRAVFDQPAIRLGRANDNDFVFDSDELRASAYHAVIESVADQYFLRDLESTNGIYIGEQQITEGPLTSGWILEFGRKGPRVLFQIKNETELTEMPAVTDPGLKAESPPRRSPQADRRQPGYRTVQRIAEAATLRGSARFRRYVVWVSVLSMVGLLAVTYLVLTRGGTKPLSKAFLRDKDFSEIVAQNQRAIALIQVQFDLLDERGRLMSEGSSEGTGFAADAQGHIITNAHIVNPWVFDEALAKGGSKGQLRSIRVIFADHTADDVLEARVAMVDADRDLAVLSIPVRSGQPYVEGFNPDMSKLRQGDEVVFLGFPLGSDLLNSTNQDRATTTLVRTTISKVSANILQVDAPVYRGFSGSPIINREGSVVGVLTARIAEAGEEGGTPARAIGVATPIGYAVELLRRVRAVP